MTLQPATTILISLFPVLEHGTIVTTTHLTSINSERVHQPFIVSVASHKQDIAMLDSQDRLAEALQACGFSLDTSILDNLILPRKLLEAVAAHGAWIEVSVNRDRPYCNVGWEYINPDHDITISEVGRSLIWKELLAVTIPQELPTKPFDPFHL